MELSKHYLHLCRDIMKAYGKTYNFAARYFPEEIADDVACFYAYVRIADEVVDSPPNNLDPKTQFAILEEYKNNLHTAVKRKYSTDPVLYQFASITLKYSIDLSYIDAFISSMQMDCSVDHYRTFKDLRTYTFGSAEVIGLVMASIMGVTHTKTLESARMLGLAFQLTNFLRDVKEDTGRQRLYLPIEELKRFKISRQDILNNSIPKNWDAFVHFWIERNRTYYNQANQAIPQLPSYAQKPIKAASILYQKIDDIIYKNPRIVFEKRVSISSAEKLLTVMRMK